jgi:hypothetical protein
MKAKSIYHKPVRLISGFLVMLALLSVSSSVARAADLCLPRHRGVPYDPDPPAIDSIIQADVGWRGAARLTYGDGTIQPHVAFQTLKHRTEDYIYLSFEVRNDTTFDNTDLIILNFRASSVGGTAADDRRIFIYPLCDGTGAAESECANLVDDEPAISGKSNRTPREVHVWKDSSGWQEILESPTDAIGTLKNFEIKVGSFQDGSANAWNLEIRLPTSTANGGTDWINFADDFLFYFNVIRTCDETACPPWGEALEFRWPREAPEVGDFVDSYPFAPDEWGEATRAAGAVCKGVWLTSSDIGTTNTPASRIQYTGPPNDFTNTFFARVSNDTEVDGVPQAVEDVKVTFKLANWGIPGHDEWTKIEVADPACPNTSNENNPTCSKDIAAAAADGTPGATTFNLEWQVPDADIPNYQARPHQCILVQLSADSDANIVTSSVHRNMDFVAASRFERNAEISAKGYGEPPEGSDGKHEFILGITKSIRRYEHKGEFYFPIDILLPPDAGSTVAASHAMRKKGGAHGALFNEIIQNLMPIPASVAGENVQEAMTWALHAYRKTGRTVTIKGRTYPIVDPVGGFGYVASHSGAVSEWTSRLTDDGDDLKPTNQQDRYTIAIPPEQVRTVKTIIEAQQPNPARRCFDWFHGK